jgi:hypothetical protein
MLKKFGDHYIQYGVVKDHGIYEHLHVSIEVAPDIPNTGVVFLNGKEIGTIEVVGKRQYEARRKVNDTLTPLATFKTVGKAAARVVTDFIE